MAFQNPFVHNASRKEREDINLWYAQLHCINQAQRNDLSLPERLEWMKHAKAILSRRKGSRKMATSQDADEISRGLKYAFHPYKHPRAAKRVPHETIDAEEDLFDMAFYAAVEEVLNGEPQCSDLDKQLQAVEEDITDKGTPEDKLVQRFIELKVVIPMKLVYGLRKVEKMAA